MAVRRPTQTQLSQIALLRDERALIVGGTGTGKSEASERIGRLFVQHYAGAKGRRMIVDTKPRFIAEFTGGGMPAARRYRKWSHGQFVPGSVVVDDPADLRRAYQTYSTVIVQGGSSRDLPRLLASVAWFLEDSRKNRPQLVQVDETMDFFNGTGQPRGGDDVLIRVARAGRERGTAGLFASQRTKAIPTTLIEEMQRLYCFRLDAKADVKRLFEMGCPEFAPPIRDYQFMYWYKKDYETVWGPYQLQL